MTRDEAIALLRSGREGVEKWNRWREEDHRTAFVYLGAADFCDMHLCGVNLRKIFLGGSFFIGANLAGANLEWANLNGVDLGDANLRGADLNGAFIRQTNLCGVDLSGAIFGGTSVLDIDLSRTIGLDEVTHLRPSSIGIDTLIMSGGKIPEIFLRGCGVPENWITHLPSLLHGMEPIQYYSCFLSHSSKDGEFSSRLHSRMRDEKLRVWFAPEDMKGGRKVAGQIDEAIRVHDKLLLVLSKKSMESEWVAREIQRARKKERDGGRRVLFPIRLCPLKWIREWGRIDPRTGEDFGELMMEYHIPDFSGWKDHDSFEKGFGELMRDLRAGEGEAGEAGE